MKRESGFSRGAVALGLAGCSVLVWLHYAGATYLNPDEAMHYHAGAGTWAQAYQYSRLQAHPPLLILLGHLVIGLGDSELALRLPSLLLGALTALILFRWADRHVGRAAALATLAFACCAPAMVSAATEFRHSELIIFFTSASLLTMEQFLSRRTMASCALYSFCLAGALMSHYGAAWVCLTLGVYVPLRLLRVRAPIKTWLTWMGFQLSLLSIAAWAFFSHGSQYTRRVGVKGSEQWYVQYHYFNGQRETAFHFIQRNWSETWETFLGLRPGWLGTVVFAISIAALAAGLVRAARRDYALLLSLPFVIGTAVSLFGIYPFGSVRHSSYLLPFAAVAFGVAVAQATAQRPAWTLAVVVGLFPLWLSLTRPANDPSKMARSDMLAAIEYIDANIPTIDPIFVDFQTNRTLAYYLRQRARERPKRINLDRLSETQLGDRFLAEPFNVWALNGDNLMTAVIPAALDYYYWGGDEIWAMSVGWDTAEPFTSRVPEEIKVSDAAFGNIHIARIRIPEQPEEEPQGGE